VKQRAVIAVALAGLLPAIFLHPAASLAAPLPLETYSASGESWGLDIRLLPISGSSPVPDIADEYYPHTYAVVNSLPHAIADGEFFDPGGTVRVGPNLGNFFVGKPIFPNYPYIARTTSDSNNPRDVDAGTAQPFTPEPGLFPAVTVPGLQPPPQTGFGSGASHAHADKTPYADATGTVSSINLGTLKAGSVTGESWSRQLGGLASATTTTTLKNVNFAGVYHIDSITVTAHVETSGPGKARTTQSVTYSGVTVNSVPATMDQDGLHIGGNTVSISQAQQALAALNAALAQSQYQMVPPHATSTTRPDGSAAVSVDGGGFTWTDGHNLSALVSFGHAELAGRAVPAAAVSTPAILPPVSTVIPPLVSNGSTETIAPQQPVGSALLHHKRLSIILVGAGGRHLLILPFVAVVSELALALLLVAANHWRKQAQASREALLAL